MKIRDAACRLSALTLGACAPPGYEYDVGNFVHPHPTASLCASQGQQFDFNSKECVAPAPQAIPAVFASAATAGRETIEQDKAWEEQLKHGACDRIRDRRTDSPTDIAGCNRQYAQTPLCVSYKGFAKIWFDMATNPANPNLNWLTIQSDVINSLGTKGSATDPAYYLSAQYREMLHRLLSVAFSPSRSRWKNADQFGDVAYKMCLEGRSF